MGRYTNGEAPPVAQEGGARGRVAPGYLGRFRKALGGVLLALLVGCDDPPCPPDAVPRAAEAFGHCIGMQQRGDGGYGCGTLAYDTFCRPARRP